MFSASLQRLFGEIFFHRATAVRCLVVRTQSELIYNNATVRRYFAEHGVPAGSTVLFTHSQPRTPVRYQSVANENWTRRIWVGVSDLIESPALAARLSADVVVGSPQQLEAIAQLTDQICMRNGRILSALSAGCADGSD